MRLKDKVAIIVGAGQQPGETAGNGRAVANAALFLASVEAGYFTGICLPVDGGLTANVG